MSSAAALGVMLIPLKSSFVVEGVADEDAAESGSVLAPAAAETDELAAQRAFESELEAELIAHTLWSAPDT